MAEVVWLETASDQLDEIVAYVEQSNTDAAERIARRIRQRANLLCTIPHRGRPARNDTREIVTEQPYIIRYRVSDDGSLVTIVSIRHSSRQPL